MRNHLSNEDKNLLIGLKTNMENQYSGIELKMDGLFRATTKPLVSEEYEEPIKTPSTATMESATTPLAPIVPSLPTLEPSFEMQSEPVLEPIEPVEPSLPTGPLLESITAPTRSIEEEVITRQPEEEPRLPSGPRLPLYPIDIDIDTAAPTVGPGPSVAIGTSWGFGGVGGGGAAAPSGKDKVVPKKKRWKWLLLILVLIAIVWYATNGKNKIKKSGKK